MAIAGLLALLVGLFYQSGEPVWDDHVLIMNDLALRPWSGMLELWVSPVGGAGPGQGYYRPLAMTVLGVLAAQGIWAIHVTTACLHAGSTFLLLNLLELQKGRLLAGLCFAVHPLASEVLGWASAFPDALAICLSLAAASCLGWSRALAMVLAVAAVASKESGVLVLPFLILGGVVPKSGWRCVLAGVFFLILARVALPIQGDFNLIGRWELVPGALFLPLSWLLWPEPLSVVHDLWVIPVWAQVLGLFVCTAMLWFARSSRLALAGLGLCLAAPLFSLIPSVSALMVGERYMYAGLVGLALWVSALVPLNRITQGIGGLLLILSLGTHLKRAGEWNNDKDLFIAALVDAPDSSLAWHFNSVVCEREGNWGCVAHSIHRSLLLGHPPDEVGGLARLLEALVNVQKAETALQIAEGRPDDAVDSDYFVWAWLRAALALDDYAAARQIRSQITRPEGWEPPEPLAGLLREIDDGGGEP